MRCPKCGEDDDKVVDSRSARGGVAIRRRRVCNVCGHRFTTYEEIAKTALRVIKRDGRHEPLDRQKMLTGVLKACEKRPIAVAEIEALVDAVISEIEATYDREVPSVEIGRRIMSRLEKLDEVAYVRFASVYRRFRHVTQFVSEVEGLMGR
ncbi:MAG: transcriptional regulator NrdR [Kiritimatiellae bacterium]|nr:transcriptional regulator NrdR [Kiritimatiellia bacterium]